MLETFADIDLRRDLPRWRRDRFAPKAGTLGPDEGPDVVLFADTFNRAFERENLDAALGVLTAAGYRVHLPKAQDRKPLCCGRTFFSVGLVDEARAELNRLVETFAPFAVRGMPIVGLEPSCLLTLRDELLSLRRDDDAKAVSAHAVLFEEFLAREAAQGRLALPLKPVADKALVHGHCHQKAFDAFTPTLQVLRLIPNLSVTPIESSCCGMAGAFGYGAETYETSMAMAEAALLPAVRQADAATLLIADGTSCRHQISDGSGRSALHTARVLAMSLDSASASS